MKGCSVGQNLKKTFMEFFYCLKKCDRKYKEIIDSIFMRKNDRKDFNNKNDKNKNIIVVQYTMVHFVQLSEQSCKY